MSINPTLAKKIGVASSSITTSPPTLCTLCVASLEISYLAQTKRRYGRPMQVLLGQNCGTPEQVAVLKLDEKNNNWNQKKEMVQNHHHHSASESKLFSWDKKKCPRKQQAIPKKKSGYRDFDSRVCCARVCWVEAKIVQCFSNGEKKHRKTYLWWYEVIINLKWFVENQQKKVYKNRLSTWPLDLKIGPPSWSLATTYATAMGPGGTTPPNGSTRPKWEGDGELAGLSTALYSPFFWIHFQRWGFCWGEKIYLLILLHR